MRNRYCLLLSTIAFLSVIQPTEAQISPDGTTATQVNGNAIAPIGAGTVNGGNLYNSFNQFNVPQSGVIFNTGNSAVNGADVRNIINRVTGDNPSAILGTIESRQAFPNANLYLMNPNGIVFGQNARLDIGGSFHATTGTGLGFDSGTFQVDKNSLSFPSGDPKTIHFAIAQPASIINQGNLAVDTGKTITFTSGSIINTGTLTAPSGNVALTAVVGNSQVELRSPDAILGLQVTSNAVPTQWNGKIMELPKLAELLAGKVPQADRVVIKADGSLALVVNPALTDITVTNGMAIVSGLVDVSSDVAKGGNVGIFGNQVGLVNAQINASGKTGGGTVLIGGDLQGKGIAPNALQAYVSPSSSILADGLFAGNGGKVIVWADDFTRFLGAISAKGGDISGDGGFVEVSGKQNLDFRGQVNTLAPKGVTGSLLLDPTDITISSSTFTSGGAFVGGIFVPSASVADISAFTLLSLLTSSNVTISTASTFTAPLGGTITVNNDLSWSGGTTPNTSLTLIADNNIVINAAINVLGGGNFTATATNNINVNGSQLTTLAGTLTLTATNGDIQIPSTTALGSFTTGNIIFTAGNGISLGGQVLSTSGGFIELVAGNGGIASTAINGINSTAPSGNSGRISIDTTGSLAVTNGIISSSGIGNGGDILIGSTRTPTSVNIGSLSSFATGTTGNGGNVDIKSIGDIVLNSANTAGSTQGGNFTAISTGGNIRLLGLVSSPFATCARASICSASNSGNTGGQISIRHGGINPFTIGDSSINGTAGIITTGSSTLALGTIFPVGNSTFTQGNVIVFPYAPPTSPIISPPLVNTVSTVDTVFTVDTVSTLPVPIGKLVAKNTDTTALLEIREIMKKEVDRFLKEDNLPKAFDAIEKAYVSELGIFLGDDLKPPVLSIDQAQELLSDASKRSGSISALIYPIMLNDRIEILVIPPKELGKPFHRYTNYANEDEIINVLMEYRANLLDPDSQDYLVQSKKL
ncbi:MAG: filamentous hemagglutinin N-terminal domain-containing protein [Pseudanabaena sp. CAN_BIN31]|nr:filamentous hemagglutinin N-terminal domain-containing protein [Pseudanabaena sp. CAN_BIN31]